MLRLAIPAWAEIKQVEDASFSFEVAPPRADGTTTRAYLLTASFNEGRLSVKESTARLLPKSCPQRHINADGSFCLALGGSPVNSEHGANAWWNRLKLYLNCQEVAHGTRQWPPYAQMSHGDAGSTELVAENLAKSLRRLDEYRNAARFNRGPIAESLWLFHTKRQSLRNGRAACLCGRITKKGKPLLRRQCGSIPNGCLVALEHKRRAQEEEFWSHLKGGSCCGTMDVCPLRTMPSVLQELSKTVLKVRSGLRLAS